MSKPISNSPIIQFLYDRYVGDDPKLIDEFEQEAADFDIAIKVRKLREAAKLTQEELAKKVGTSKSSISRLENVEYKGHSLSMLRRIAAVVGRRVEISFPLIKG